MALMKRQEAELAVKEAKMLRLSLGIINRIRKYISGTAHVLEIE